MESQKVPVEETNLPLARTEEEYLKDMTETSDLVFIGVVVGLGKPPLFWSGHSNAYQAARYKIEKILKGKYDAPEISVDHVLVYESSTAQPGETPHLSRALFATNSQLIVSANNTSKGWKSLNEEYGALPANEEWLQKIKAAM
ncbi:hypothetical protein L0222_12925 [bacterium]|nr:hypothetical protein [bacterium]MCI0605711.1 hypothetical protein [bacterium]